MKSILLMGILLLCSLIVMGQESISSQGDSYSNSSASMDFTIGEVLIDTGTDGTNDITQGFHQTKWNFVDLENIASQYDATIFPNPTQEILNIKSTSFENVSYNLYDAIGKLVVRDVLLAQQVPIHIGHLDPGHYVLTLNNRSQNLKTFKLIKYGK